MRISLELDQEWQTANAMLEYFRKLERTLQRICEMEAEAPTNWFFEVRPINAQNEEWDIKLTHL